MKFNTKALVAPAQQQLDQAVNNQLVNNIVGGTMQGVGTVLNNKINQQRLSGMRSSMASQLQEIEGMLADSKLHPLQRLALQKEKYKLQNLFSVNDVDEALKLYFGTQEKSGDPLSQYTDLEKAKIAGQYDVAASQAYGAARSKDDIADALETIIRRGGTPVAIPGIPGGNSEVSSAMGRLRQAGLLQ